MSSSSRDPACAHLNVCVTSFENPDFSDEERILNWQEELLPKAEAVRPFTEVSNQLVYEVNIGRNIPLTLSLFLFENVVQ